MHVEQLFHKGRITSQTASGEQEPVEDLGSYGLIRSVRDRLAMVELQKRDGEMLAIPYAMMEKIVFKPDVGITIHVMGSEIHIKGQHLNVSHGTKITLFNGLCRHRVAWIRENPRAIGADAQAAIIESIVW